MWYCVTVAEIGVSAFAILKARLISSVLLAVVKSTPGFGKDK
jgi:hypothetical protein